MCDSRSCAVPQKYEKKLSVQMKREARASIEAGRKEEVALSKTARLAGQNEALKALYSTGTRIPAPPPVTPAVAEETARKVERLKALAREISTRATR